jgi:RNA polymerase sigma factor (sigma-70 family)
MSAGVSAIESPANVYRPGARCPDCGRPLYTDFEAWYRAYSGPLRRQVARLMSRSMAVEPDDVVQETFLDFSRMEVTEVNNPGAWLNTVARRKVTSALHDSALIACGDVTTIIEGDEQRRRWTSMARTTDLETKLAARQALRELADLPNRQKVVSYLHWVRGWSQVEIAEFLGISRNTVAVHVHAARRRLNSFTIDASHMAAIAFGSVNAMVIGRLDGVSDPTRYTSTWVWCTHWSGEPQRWFNPELHAAYQRRLRELQEWRKDRERRSAEGYRTRNSAAGE